MPIPKRPAGQPLKDFVSSCMANEVMKSEYPDVKQRYAICRLQAKKKK